MKVIIISFGIGLVVGGCGGAAGMFLFLLSKTR